MKLMGVECAGCVGGCGCGKQVRCHQRQQRETGLPGLPGNASRRESKVVDGVDVKVHVTIVLRDSFGLDWIGLDWGRSVHVHDV